MIIFNKITFFIDYTSAAECKTAVLAYEKMTVRNRQDSNRR